MERKEILYIAVPCYNEETVLPETMKRLKEKITNLISTKKISSKSKILFVNDGSTDNTWNIIKNISNKDKQITGISLSRNFGHQNALLSGLLTAKEQADIIISLDADLQDDIDTIDKMLSKYYEGNEIVYGVRNNRKSDNLIKKSTAECFYKLTKKLGIEIIYNHADFRLTSKRVLNELEKFNEVNLFLRGIFPLIGFKHTIVYYKRNSRYAGKSKYSINKMLNFGFDGITSFSIKPIRFILLLGTIIFLISTIICISTLIINIIKDTLNNWSFLIYSIWIATSLQMISLGIIGEYVGKTYMETKKRPVYIIEENLDNRKER